MEVTPESMNGGYDLPAEPITHWDAGVPHDSFKFRGMNSTECLGLKHMFTLTERCVLLLLEILSWS